MNKDEILKQAKAKLPYISRCNLEKIIIFIQKPLPLLINNNVLPKSKSLGYEVYFEKHLRFVGDKAVWRQIMFTEI
jgi:hypothetical protein